MSRTLVIAALAAAGALLGGCSSGIWSFGGPQARVIPEVPAGATAYDCDGGKRLIVRYAKDGNSAWVIYPDREFRLDRIPSASGEQFSNNITTLATKGNEALLTENGALTFANCKQRGG